MCISPWYHHRSNTLSIVVQSSSLTPSPTRAKFILLFPISTFPLVFEIECPAIWFLTPSNVHIVKCVLNFRDTGFHDFDFGTQVAGETSRIGLCGRDVDLLEIGL